jgi:hypothetical protein
MKEYYLCIFRVLGNPCQDISQTLVRKAFQDDCYCLEIHKEKGCEEWMTDKKK